MRNLARGLSIGLLVMGGGLLLGAGCAEGTGGDDDGAGGTTATGIGATGGGGAGGISNCPIDCGTIETDQCRKGVCNEEDATCVIVAQDDDTPCDDEQFCTVDDSCQDGACMGGGENDCGQSPDPCEDVVCNESSETCSTNPRPNGASCISQNLCLVNATCTNGLCSGSPKDCLFAPVPNECYESVCNPNSGDCEPEPAHDGDTCHDENDECLINGTCSGGDCNNTAAKDCSHMTAGCFNGACDPQNGSCYEDPVSAGGSCDEAADECNEGICDANGDCDPSPINNGGACDTDGCFVGQTCSGGTCQGGSEITDCIHNDDCCPAACAIGNDDDCGCHWGLIGKTTPFSSNPAITDLITAMGHTYDLLENNGTTGVHTSNAATINSYQALVLNTYDRAITATEQTNLQNFVDNGGRLLVTGYDALGSPTDTLLASVVNCLSPADTPFSDALTVVTAAHPIMQGPFGVFTQNQTLTAATTDHDTCAPGPGAIQLMTVSTTSKLLLTENVGPGNGKVLYWNGNGSSIPEDWTGAHGGSQPDLQHLFQNVLNGLCE